MLNDEEKNIDEDPESGLLRYAEERQKSVERTNHLVALQYTKRGEIQKNNICLREFTKNYHEEYRTA